MATTVTYKGQTLTTVENQTKTLQTAGKWCEDDFTLTDVTQGGAGEWTTEGIASRTEPNGAITINASNVTGIGRNAFYGCKEITELTIVGTPFFGYEAFRDCTNIETINARDLTAIKGNRFGSQTNLFYGCSKLKGIVLPSLDGSVYNIDGRNFGGCSSMEYADINNLSKLADRVFSGCTVLDTLIIRKTDGVPNLQTLTAFENTPFASGKTGGTLYVPSALISSYQSATNWSTILGYSTNSIQAIEGSQYETQYADGTVIA